jgi:hypothetical protein
LAWPRAPETTLTTNPFKRSHHEERTHRPDRSDRLVIQYRAENLRIVQVFGPAALAVSPRIGHIHVTVDDAPWRWADASGEPLIINGLPAGPHKVLIELVNANHQTLDRGVVNFVIP